MWHLWNTIIWVNQSVTSSSVGYMKADPMCSNGLGRFFSCSHGENCHSSMVFLVCKKCKYRLWAIWEWNTTRKACFSTGSIHFGIWLVASMIQPPTCRCLNCVNCVNCHQLLCFYWKQPGEYGRNKSQNPCGSLSMAGPPSLFRGWTPHIKSCWTTSIPFSNHIMQIKLFKSNHIKNVIHNIKIKSH